MIRPLRIDECRALAESVAPQPLLQRYQITAERLAADLTAALERGEPVLAAEDEQGRARGFAWFFSAGTFGLGGYLRLIALEPGAEGRGLGTALLDELERRVAQSSRHLFLLVSHWNDAARRFYGRRGYSEVGTLPAFLRADTDEIICWKPLR